MDMAVGACRYSFLSLIGLATSRISRIEVKLEITMRLDETTPANCCIFCEGKDDSNLQTVDDGTQIKQLGDDTH
jgi:hypothetical protein